MKKMLIAGIVILGALALIAGCANPLADSDGGTAAGRSVSGLELEAGLGQIDVSWLELSGNFREYQLRITPEGGDTELHMLGRKDDGEKISFTASDLVSGTEYSFEVRIIANNGRVAEAGTSDVATPLGLDDVAVLDFSVSGGVGSITATWTDPKGAWDTVELLLSSEGKDDQEMSVEKGTERAVFSDDLESGEYTITARIAIDGTQSTKSAEASDDVEGLDDAVIGMTFVWTDDQFAGRYLHMFNVEVPEGEDGIDDTTWPGVQSTNYFGVNTVTLDGAIGASVLIHTNSGTQTPDLVLSGGGTYLFESNLIRTASADSGVTVRWPEEIDGKSYNRVWYWDAEGADDIGDWGGRPDLTAVDGWFEYTIADATAVGNFRPDDGTGNEFSPLPISSAGTWVFESTDKAEVSYSFEKQ
ncbi:fibronectin type III domain-containing protein [Spirochaeta dissipatitropha]